MARIEDVIEFQRKFGLLVSETPHHLTDRKLKERVEFLKEEWDEFVQGCEEQDLAKQADALVDLVNVALGTAASMGLPWDKLWADVHKCNMNKVRGNTKRGHLVDCMKPEGWVPPNTEAILYEAGYHKNFHSRKENYKDDLAAISKNVS